MLRPRLDVPTYAIVEDSPTALVLENKASRYLAGAAALVLAGFLSFGPMRLTQPVRFGAADVTLPAHLLFAGLVLLGVVGACDRQLIVFDRVGETVEFTSRLKPWRRLRLPLAHIQRVETRADETTYYSSSGARDASVTHHVELIFQDGRRREVTRSNDADFVRALAARLEAMRR